MKDKILQQFSKKKTFFQYQNKTKNAYFSYLGLCSILFLSVFIFCLFAAINVAKHKLYNLALDNFNYNVLNLLYAPIICLITVFISLSLLIFAPNVATTSSKWSNKMFYTSFWLLILSVMISAEIQISYISQKNIVNNGNYNWIKPVFAKIFIIISIFLILVVQVFFWIMRRRFSFMKTDYEIYNAKNHKKLKKQQLKN